MHKTKNIYRFSFRLNHVSILDKLKLLQKAFVQFELFFQKQFWLVILMIDLGLMLLLIEIGQVSLVLLFLKQLLSQVLTMGFVCISNELLVILLLLMHVLCHAVVQFLIQIYVILQVFFS